MSEIPPAALWLATRELVVWWFAACSAFDLPDRPNSNGLVDVAWSMWRGRCCDGGVAWLVWRGWCGLVGVAWLVWCLYSLIVISFLAIDS